MKKLNEHRKLCEHKKSHNKETKSKQSGIHENYRKIQRYVKQPDQQLFDMNFANNDQLH